MFGFTTALSHLMQGKRVRRAAWFANSFVEVSGDSIVDENDEDFCNVNNSSDLLTDDWELA